ncbi:MAG: NAD(P)H-binding protein [Chloroflexota bacterium]
MILVTGATGFIGRKLVERLAAKGYPVQILLPPTNRPRKIVWPEQVVTVKGSIDDAESLHQAMVGVHTVFHMASAQWWGHRRDLERVDLQGTRNVITAARSARIGRLEIVSHLGAAPSSAFTLMRLKGQVEELVRSSGLAYTIFRSGIVFGREDSFVNGIAMLLRTNPVLFFQPGHGDNLLHPLYIDDLVEAMLRSLENLNTVDQVLEIGGPEYVTYNEMVRTIMRVTQAPRMLVTIQPYLLRSLTQIINRIMPRWPMTPQWLDILAANRTASLGNMPDIFGIRPVRFEDTIVTYMHGRRYLPELLRTTFRRRHIL